MTYQRREEIFSKEAISTPEMAELLGVSLSEASVKIGNMKRKVGDRLGIKGRIHIQDYLEACRITELERYRNIQPDSTDDVKSCRTVCI